MAYALLICSDEDCAEVFEAYGRLEEIEVLGCQCGCGLMIVGWPDDVEDPPALQDGVELVPVAIQAERLAFNSASSTAHTRGHGRTDG